MTTPREELLLVRDAFMKIQGLSHTIKPLPPIVPERISTIEEYLAAQSLITSTYLNLLCRQTLWIQCRMLPPGGPADPSDSGDKPPEPPEVAMDWDDFFPGWFDEPPDDDEQNESNDQT